MLVKPLTKLKVSQFLASLSRYCFTLTDNFTAHLVANRSNRYNCNILELQIRDSTEKSGTNSISQRLPIMFSIYSAELCAIKLALLQIPKMRYHSHIPFSYSMSSLQAIASKRIEHLGHFYSL